MTDPEVEKRRAYKREEYRRHRARYRKRQAAYYRRCKAEVLIGDRESIMREALCLECKQRTTEAASGLCRACRSGQCTRCKRRMRRLFKGQRAHDKCAEIGMVRK